MKVVCGIWQLEFMRSRDQLNIQYGMYVDVLKNAYQEIVGSSEALWFWERVCCSVSGNQDLWLYVRVHALCQMQTFSPKCELCGIFPPHSLEINFKTSYRFLCTLLFDSPPLPPPFPSPLPPPHSPHSPLSPLPSPPSPLSLLPTSCRPRKLSRRFPKTMKKWTDKRTERLTEGSRIALHPAKTNSQKKVPVHAV